MISEFITQYPPQIAESLFQVAGSVETIARNEYNSHGRYPYASVDKFYELVQPEMVKAGILIQPVEMMAVESEVDGQIIITLRYAFRFIHRSGIVYFNPEEQKEIKIRWGGPQTYGAAQSYVHKFYLRGLFTIATGDPDADAEKPEHNDRPERDGRRTSRPAERRQERRDRDERDDRRPPARKGDDAEDRHAGAGPHGIVFSVSGKLYTFKANEVAEKLEPLLADMFPIDREPWLKDNEGAMNELRQKNAPEWHRVKKLLEVPADGRGP